MPDPLVVTTMNAFKADLLRQETTQMAAMARRWRQTEAALIDQVELFARRVADDKLSRAQLQDAQYMLDRSQSLLRQARAEFDKYVRYAGPLIETRQRQLGEQGIQHAAAAINAVGTEAGVEIGFNRLPTQAVENMVGLAGDNSPLTTLLESKYGDGVDGMFTELIRATALGKNPRETAQRMVREGFSQSLTQMMVIARTEQLRVYREAARQAYQESGVVEAFRRLATRDNRVCAACMMADGEYYELNEMLRSHVQCRCTTVPSVEGFPEVQWQKGPDWFIEQSPETQNKILGPGRYAAWKDGLFDLDQLMTLRTNAQWGDSVQPTSLKALLDGTAQRYNVQRELPNPFGRNDFEPPPWVTGATGTASRGGQEVPTAADMEAARLRGEARRREEEERQRQAAEERRLQEEREAAAREALRLRQEQEEREAAAARATARAQDGGASATRARIVEIADTYQPRIDELKRDAEKMQTERGALLSLVGKLEINATRRAGTPQEQQLLASLEQKRAEQAALSQRVLANRRQQNALTAEIDGKISPLLTVSNPARATLSAGGEPDATVAVWQIGLDQFNRMVSSDIVPPGSIPFRRQDDDFAAHYDTNDKTVNLGRKAPPGIVAHELMHWLEDHNPEILQKQLDFFNRRTAGETTTQLDKNNAGIVGKRDKFIVYYMGREYVYRGVHVATEIGSMGLEYMIERPTELARKDPDMFDFIFDLLRGR